MLVAAGQNLYLVLREDFWQLRQVLEDAANDKEQKCSLESQRREECAVSAFGKMNWSGVCALLHLLLTALQCVSFENKITWFPSVHVALFSFLWPLKISISATLQIFCSGLCYVLLVNTDSCLHACFPAHEKITEKELNLLVLICNFRGLKGVVLADTVPIPVLIEGWAKNRAGHQQISGEKGALHEGLAEVPAAEQTALVLHPSWSFSIPMAPFVYKEIVIIRHGFCKGTDHQYM